LNDDESGVAADREVGCIDFSLAAADQIADDAGGAAAHRPAERAVASVEEQSLDFCRTDNGCAIRRHWTKTGPEERLGHVPTGEEIGYGMLERAAAGSTEVVGIA